MFGIFKKKTARQKLQKKYELLLKEGYDLSTSDRTKSYLKIAEAQEVLAEIEELAKMEKDG